MKALLAFFTVFPVRGASVQEAAREVHLLPLVGLFAGLPGAALILLASFVPPGVAATLALGAVLLAAGLHHADGVLDVGDALMVRGSQTRRRQVLADARVGVGGLAALFIVYAPTLAALAALTTVSPGRAALALLAGEISARSAMLLMLAFGEPAEERSSSFPFVRALEGERRPVGLILALLAPLPFLLPLGGFAALGGLSAPVVALCALRVSRTAFGGIGGDATGATGETCRALLLVFASATL